MKYKITLILGLLFLVGCSDTVSKSDVLQAHNVDYQVNGSAKLTDAEGDLIGLSGQSFFMYQRLRHDPRSYVVNSLAQSGKRVDYLVGDGFFLIDKIYLERVKPKDLTQALFEITADRKKKNRYTNG